MLDKALRAHDWASAANTTAAASRSEEGQSAQAPRPRRILFLDGESDWKEAGRGWGLSSQESSAGPCPI